LSQNKNEKAREPKSKLFVRIMAIILALLMVSGTIVSIILYLVSASFAYTPGNDPVRVGLMYGTGVTVGFETTAEHGFDFGTVDGTDQYLKLGQVTDTCVSVTCDANLAKSGRTYSKTSSTAPHVGGYHIEVNSDAASWQQNAAQYVAILAGFGINNAFPAYINNEYKIRIGQYATADSARSALSLIQSAGFLGNAQIVSPSSTAVSVINPYTDIIVFEYDCGGVSELGLCAVQPADGTTTYLVTPANNTYLGIFEFSRYINGNTDGVALTNIVTVDDYVRGVLPWEINNTWPLESQKAFAVTVRSFALSMRGRHETAYGFDLCNGTHCQAYMGENRVNDTVKQAVSETSGMVIKYNGSIARTYYSAVTGGSTVGIDAAWGGNTDTYPYLKAIPTPWEKYSEHSKGSWVVEVSPTQLLNTLRKAGHTNLGGAIANVVVDKYADNSFYAYSITFTDTYGNTATIKKSDTIRTTLSDYIRSANFIVTKAGGTVEVKDYVLPEDFGGSSVSQTPSSTVVSASQVLETEGVHIISSGGLFVTEIEGSVNITSSEEGAHNVTYLNALMVVTEDGYYNYDMQAENQRYYDSAFTSTLPGLPELTLPTPSKTPASYTAMMENMKTSTTLVTAEGTPGNFIFVGRGWGHGVGLSQWGVKDLANLGFTYDNILTAYFPGTVIEHY